MVIWFPSRNVRDIGYLHHYRHHKNQPTTLKHSFPSNLLKLKNNNNKEGKKRITLWSRKGAAGHTIGRKSYNFSSLLRETRLQT